MTYLCGHQLSSSHILQLAILSGQFYLSLMLSDFRTDNFMCIAALISDNFMCTEALFSDNFLCTTALISDNFTRKAPYSLFYLLNGMFILTAASKLSRSPIFTWTFLSSQKLTGSPIFSLTILSWAILIEHTYSAIF